MISLFLDRFVPIRREGPRLRVRPDRRLTNRKDSSIVENIAFLPGMEKVNKQLTNVNKQLSNAKVGVLRDSHNRFFNTV
jgi:hypothetical protein